MPPKSSSGYRFSTSSKPNSFSFSCKLYFSRLSPTTSKPRRAFCLTLRHGKSKSLCNTVPILSEDDSDGNLIAPNSGRSRPLIKFSKVVLPEPVGPKTAVISLSKNVIEKSLKISMGLERSPMYDLKVSDIDDRSHNICVPLSDQ